MVAPKGHEDYASPEEQTGRPVIYTPEFIDKMAIEFSEWLKNPMNVWFKDFALDRDLNPDLLSIWAKENERFSGVYQLAKHRQESRLINGGLINLYNGSIVKLVLSNAHGWSDKQESKLSGDAVNPLALILSRHDGQSKDLINDECN